MQLDRRDMGRPDKASHVKRLSRLLVLFGVIAVCAAMPALASAQSVQVRLGGNWCYVGGLAKFTETMNLLYTSGNNGKLVLKV